MNDFMFYNPVRVYFGKEQLKNLAGEVNKHGKKVLVVYGGRSIKSNGIYDDVISSLDDFELFELSGIEPNPDVKFVRQGAAICKKEGIDVILAIGGGSVIDASKWIAAAACADFDAWDFFNKKTTIDKSLPLITVVTIAASGSEMNCGGVISNREQKKKIGRSNPLLFPQASFLNPEYTYGVSAYQTACGAVDIISHIMEVYFNTQEGMGMLESIMESIVKIVVENGAVAINSPCNYEARANLMWAASWAINGFISGPVRQGWNCHTIEHELSARYGISHGHGLAIIIPRWLRYCYCDDNRKTYEKFALNVFGLTQSDDVGELLASRIDKLFFDEYRLKSRLRDLDIPYDELKDVAFSICGNGTISGFMNLDYKDVFQILEACY